MLKEIKEFFSELAGAEAPSDSFVADDYRLAAAALLVHVATLDHENLTAEDRAALFTLLQTRFELSDAQTGDLISAALDADRQAVDFYQFTSRLNHSLNDAGRRKIVAMMWDMAFTDGRITEFEENVMWRVADLLGITTRERVEMRADAAARRGDLP
jgi:uncharacterized tellurite resistance protein B-like protein